jgi:hypothetical protein
VLAMRMAASVMALSEEENIDCAKVIHNYGPNGLLCAWNLLSHRANLTAEQLRRFRSFVLCWHWGLSRKGDTKSSARQKLRFPLQLFVAPPSQDRPRPSIIASPMFIQRIYNMVPDTIRGSSPPPGGPSCNSGPSPPAPKADVFLTPRSATKSHLRPIDLLR